MKNILLWAIIFLSFALCKGQSYYKNPFEKIDAYARECPDSVETSIKTLAKHLQKTAKTDVEKARVIYVWITDNIKYDDVAYNLDKDIDCSAEEVLRAKKTVCEGYSNLYLSLGQEMDLKILKINGYSKGYGYTVGQKLTETDHAWNIIKIEGQWRIFDATWGQGYGITVKGKLVSKKKFDNYWFNVDPYEAVFNHFPENADDAFVSPIIDLTAYEEFPKASGYFFEIGFKAKDIYNKVYANHQLTFPTLYDLGTEAKINKAPAFGILYVDSTYQFEIDVPKGLDVSIVDSKKKSIEFKKEKTVFSLGYTPTNTGKIKIEVMYDKELKNSKHTFVHAGFLEYTISKP